MCSRFVASLENLKAASEVATASRVMLAEVADVIYRRVRCAALSKEGECRLRPMCDFFRSQMPIARSM